MAGLPWERSHRITVSSADPLANTFLRKTRWKVFRILFIWWAVFRTSFPGDTPANDPTAQDADLSSLFQDKSSTASVCPSTGSAAAAPCHQWEEAALSFYYAIQADTNMAVYSNDMEAGSYLLALLFLLGRLFTPEWEHWLQTVHHIQVPHVYLRGHVANSSIISCSKDMQGRTLSTKCNSMFRHFFKYVSVLDPLLCWELQAGLKIRLNWGSREINPLLVWNGTVRQSEIQFSYQVLLQGLGQSSATPHTVGKLAAEYHDERTGIPPQNYKL